MSIYWGLMNIDRITNEATKKEILSNYNSLNSIESTLIKLKSLMKDQDLQNFEETIDSMIEEVYYMIDDDLYCISEYVEKHIL